MTEPTEIERAAKEVPEIKGEEDIPFPSNGTRTGTAGAVDRKLDRTDNLSQEITRFRYRTGGKVLYISMIAMGIAVITDLIASAFGIENGLVNNAFEVFKLITMTVLGYIFGSNNGKS